MNNYLLFVRISSVCTFTCDSLVASLLTTLKTVSYSLIPCLTVKMPAIIPDLKQAITRLPEKEKDKLLLKLVAKDALLVERLEFELIEHGQTVDERRLTIREFIDRTVRLKQDTAGWIMMDMRTISGYISRHLKVTKDKYGEVELGLYMLNSFFENDPINSVPITPVRTNAPSI